MASGPKESRYKVKRKFRRVPPTTEELLTFYDAYLRDENLSKVAEVMGVERSTIYKRIELHPEYRIAKEMANKNRGSREDLADYIIGHLSPETKKIWDKLQFWSSNEHMEGKMRELTAACPTRIRQELYLHALVRSNFDPSSALRMTGTSRRAVVSWTQSPDFRKLVKEIEWHKKNFFEKALMDLVEIRHPGAIMFVNRTINADRGYGEKIEHQHSGTISLNTINIEDLELPIETRRQILDAIRRRKEKERLLRDTNERGEILDAEIVKQLPERVDATVPVDEHDEELAA